MAKSLKQSYFHSNFSRLLVDPNRKISDYGLILEQSFGTTIPGNIKLSKIEKTKRIDMYNSYHLELEKLIKKKNKSYKKLILVSIHSFTQNTLSKKWSISVGLLWNKNMNLLIPIQKKLSEKRVHFGRNYPYSGFHYNYTLDRHSGNGLLDNISIEIRNDLICKRKGINKYSKLLKDIFLSMFDE